MRFRRPSVALATAFVLTALFAAFSPASADESPAPTAESGTTVPVNLKVNAEVRHRLEIDGREKFDPDRSTTEQSFLRSRLSVAASLPKNVSVFLQGQDARIWGEEISTLSGTSPGGDMHQGYILAEDFMTPGLWLKLGRMEMAYGNERLIGRNDWTNAGRAFDGVIVGYKGPTFSVDVFETKIGEGVGNPTRGLDYDFLGAYATTGALAGHTIDLFALFDRDADTLATGEERLKRLTMGGRVVGAQGAIGYEVEGAAQTGDAGASSVSASLLAGSVSYTIGGAYQPSVSLGVTRLSGDDDPTDNEVKVFDTLFATNHLFYGYMDFFTDIPTSTMGAGLLDIHFRGAVRPTSWLGASAEIHSFRSAEDFEASDGAGGTEKHSAFGNELDLTAEITCTENVDVQSGLSVFLPGEIFELTRGEDNTYWAYLQTSVHY